MTEEIILEGIKSHHFSKRLSHIGYEIYFSNDKMYGIKLDSKAFLLFGALFEGAALKMLYDEDKIHKKKYNIEELKKESDFTFDKNDIKEIILQKPMSRRTGDAVYSDGYFKISSYSGKTVQINFFDDLYTKVKFLLKKNFPDKIMIIE